ncbi:adenylate/guanylate cyclase domain-containing protein [Alteromonas ponticola]|uniref:Adenylate/guanylate cyclase domain-containing protein n=1 Tax=Alteromonas aquimaris TaxID=2998417 RepID=A0ABT3P5Y3_9ALTE|nr:adenylate/guanylate cyclase domain-containing protein [Alteromonas aquimaris]MCW8108175.1 adenylate/guanylate cyclase domain-containing protein [Alteromonas aquimaris]
MKWFTHSILLITFLGLEVYCLFPFEHWTATMRLTNSITLMAASCMILLSMQHYARQKWRHLKALQRKTHEVIESFLPQPQHLAQCQWPKGYQERFDNVCVLFADLHGYTQLSQHYDDDEIVAILDSLYRQFDQLASRFNIEKLKTNGDEYMAVAGLPFMSSTAVTKQQCIGNAIEFARHMVKAVNRVFGELHMPCDIRVGIAMGSVTGGVIGSQRPCFDVWGKTVNRAARLEQAVTPGYIAVCEVIARSVQSTQCYQVILVQQENASHHILA